MLPRTSRKRRAEIIASFPRDRFDTEEDYYFYIHSDDRVQALHSVGFIAALPIFIVSIIKLSLPLFILQYLVSTGFSVGAHWLFDGFVPSGPAKTPFRVLRFGFKKTSAFF